MISIHQTSVLALYSATYGREDLLKERISEVFKHAASLEEEFETRYAWIRFISTTSLQEAINECHLFLVRLGEPMDATDIGPGFVHSELVRIKDLLMSEETPQILASSQMTDQDKLKAMKILQSLAFFYFYQRSLKSPLIIMKMVEISMKFGYSGESIFALAAFSSNVVGFLHDVDMGCSLARMALALMSQFGHRANAIFPSVISVVYGFSLIWKEPLQVRSRNMNLNYECLCTYISFFVLDTGYHGTSSTRV
jgi:predicted ATPase